MIYSYFPNPGIVGYHWVYNGKRFDNGSLHADFWKQVKNMYPEECSLETGFVDTGVYINSVRSVGSTKYGQRRPVNTLLPYQDSVLYVTL